MTYLFECDKCGTKFERNISMSEYDQVKDKQKCTECGNKLKRVIEFSGSIGLSNGMYGIDSGNGWNS